MSDYSDRPDTIPFRLLDAKDDFYRFTDKENLTPSKALRHLIKQTANNKVGLSPTEQRKMLDELIELRKQLSRIGGNLNQIARYFNQHEHLIESDLRKNLEQAKMLFSETTETLKGVANVIR